MDRILGITAEYDPFHSGHAYQLRQARKLAGPDAVICVMSGNFTQRGEPAVLDKWTRAAIAVRQGVDLVFELPFMYACNQADKFASGAVDMLISAGVTHISFGCEAEQPEDLNRLVDSQLADQEKVDRMSHDLMKAGYSRAKATEIVSRKLFGGEMTDLMLQPNNILALEYLKRVSWWEKARNVKISSVPIRRYGSGYGGVNREAGYAGGTAIRRMIQSGQDIAPYLSYDGEGIRWTDLRAARERIYDAFRAIVLRSSGTELSKIYCVGEGIENRFIREIRENESYDEFLSAMISRRYSAAVIRRQMIYILMNVDEMPYCSPYGIVLAANETGRKVLRQIQDGGQACLCEGEEDAGAPGLKVIANTTRTEDLSEEIRTALQLDFRASDMYHLITGQDIYMNADQKRHPHMQRVF